MNKLYYGDCLTVMREMKPKSVDLIYLDPPFNSNRTYSAIYKDETGRPLPDQIAAFCDMWTIDEERERAIRNMPILMLEAGIANETVEFWQKWVQALRGTQPRLLAYLSYMVQRLVVMKGLLRPTGSIYLHCDPTASHYIKVMMDGIFGHENFRNEIVWKRTSAHSGARRYGPIHDIILFYSAGRRYVWNKIYQSYDEDYLEQTYRYKDAKGRRYSRICLTGPGTRAGSSGLPWRDYNPTTAGRHWALPSDSALPQWFEQPPGYSEMSVQKRLDVLDAQSLIYSPKKMGGVPRFKRYLSVTQGVPAQDVITDIGPISAFGMERMGYDTQKPLALLKRIIEASTNKGDLVLDPFCGCATTLEAAQALGRDWIGIDIAIHAVKRVAKQRLGERCKLVEGTDFTISGVPRNLEGAKDLWERDKYHFQKWAVEEVDGFVTTNRTADGGIDGRLYFGLPDEKDLQSMVLEVKGGAKVPLNDLRALRGVLAREEAVMAGLIIMSPLRDRKANNFAQEAAAAGDLEVMGKPYPRLQVLSVPEILEGKRFDTPGVVGKVGQVNLRLASG